jgi:hypothetical protein
MPVTSTNRTHHARQHLRYGWTALAVGLAFGVTLESLLGFKTVAYLLDPLREELWRLAHLHLSMLALVNLVYASWADRESLSPAARRLASRALIAGSMLLPLGFFFGGIAHYEGDPGIGIFLAPPGAILVLIAAAIQARAAWRNRD